jgi:hypothetical protein
MRTPPKVDLQKNCTDISVIIDNLKLALTGTQERIKEIEGNKLKLIILGRSERTELAELKILAIELKKDIETKENLFEEYMHRCIELQEQETLEYKDYLKNGKTIKKQANNYKKDYSLPTEVRNHLKIVLKQDTTNFNTQQKVDYYLALKKEVLMCQQAKTTPQK